MVKQRRFVRVDVPIRVWYRLKGKKVAKGEAVSKNISGGGICIHVSHTFAVGSLLKLTLGVPGASEPIETEAEVVWVNKTEKGDEGFRTDCEAGLKFTSLSQVARATIVNFVYESVKGRRRSASPPPAPRSARDCEKPARGLEPRAGTAPETPGEPRVSSAVKKRKAVGIPSANLP